jgi:GDP-fucose transporter C1
MLPIYCFQVVRSLTVIISLCWSSYCGDKISSYSVLGCILVVSGFLLAYHDPSETCDMNGYALGSVGAVFVVAYTFMVRSQLRTLSIIEVMLFTNAWIVVLSLPAAVAFAMTTDSLSAALPSTPSLLSLFASCVASASVNFASVNQVEKTSPLTHSLSTTCKSVLQSVIDAKMRNTALTAQFWIATGVIACGSLVYGFGKPVQKANT